MDTLKFKKISVKMIAHRGLSGIETENTAAAFVAAGNRDYCGIETDVHKTADGRYIIIHDDTTGRVAPIDLSVEKSGFDTLRALNLYDKNGGSRADLCLPTLNEYLRICKRYDKLAVLELKNAFGEADICEIVDICRKEYSLDKMIFISFVFENLTTLKKHLPNVAVQFLCDCKIDGKLIEKLKKHKMDIDARYDRLSKKTIKLLHDNGMAVNCWTCDDPKDADALAKWGVDFITSNILQ